MKILFDLTALEEKPTGILRVTENIAKTFIHTFPEHEYVLVFYKKIPSRFLITESTKNIEIIILQSKHKIMRLVDLPLTMKKSDADWIICSALPGPLTLNDKRVVSVIHDLTCWKYPKTMIWYSKLKWKCLISHAVRTNKYILNISETVKQEVKEKFHNTNSVAICNGVDIMTEEDYGILKKFSLENNRYILSVATLEPRKNLKVLLEAFQQMNNDSGIKLVLTGGKGWKLLDAIGEIDAGAKENIIFTGYVSDAELNTLYNNAKLFVSASVYEGFGLPVIEAIRHDLPVLISDIPVYREITNGKAMYFRHDDVAGLKNALEMCVKADLKATPEFTELQSHAKQYTWENYVKKLHQVLMQSE